VDLDHEAQSAIERDDMDHRDCVGEWKRPARWAFEVVSAFLKKVIGPRVAKTPSIAGEMARSAENLRIGCRAKYEDN